MTRKMAYGECMCIASIQCCFATCGLFYRLYAALLWWHAMPHTFAAPAYIGNVCKVSEVAHKIAKIALHMYSFSCAVSTIQSGGDTLMILHQRPGNGEPIMPNDAFKEVVLVE